jgi:hypothetical protein
MTETATEAPEQAPLVFKDNLHEMQHQMFSELITKRNDLVGRLNAATGDRQSLTEQIRENSTDPAIVEAREKWSQAYEELMALVTPVVEETITNSAGSTDELETEIKAVDETLKPGLTFYKKVYGEDAFKHFPTQERLKGAASVRGTGGRRVRGFNLLVQMGDKTQEFENFTQAAKFLEIDTSDLQTAFFKKAGTEVLKEVPNEVKITLTITNTDENGTETSEDAFITAYRTETKEEAAATEPADAPEATETSDDVDTGDEDSLSAV